MGLKKLVEWRGLVMGGWWVEAGLVRRNALAKNGHFRVRGLSAAKILIPSFHQRTRGKKTQQMKIRSRGVC